MSILKGLDDAKKVTTEQVRAARGLLRWSQNALAEASLVSVPTIKRLEAQAGVLGGQRRTARAIVTALEAAGIEFIPENGGGPGVRLKAKRQ